MNINENGLSFGTVIDTSGIDEGAAHIEQRIAQVGDSVESEGSRINEIINGVPKLNIEVVSNASESLSAIKLGYQEIDTVIDANLNAIKELEAEYNRLKKASGEAWEKKDFDKSDALEREARSVMSLTMARKQAIKEAEKQAQKLQEQEKLLKDSEKQHISLRQQIKALKEQMAQLIVDGIDEESDAYKRLANELGRLTDIQGDIAQQGKVLANDEQQVAGLIQGLSGLSGAFSAAQGAVALFGSENEDLQKIMLKVQSLMAITMGLQQVQQTLNKDSAFQLVTLNGLREWWNKLLTIGAAEAASEAAATTKNAAAQAADATASIANAAAKNAKVEAAGRAAVAEEIDTAATTANATAATAGTAANITLAGAFRMVGAAIKSIPVFGWIAAAIGVLIGAISHLRSEAEKADEEFKEQQKILEDGRKKYAEASVAIDEYKRKIEQFNGTKEQEKRLVEELNAEYGSSMGYYKSLDEWKRVLTEKGDAYCKKLMKEAEAQAILNKYTEAFIQLQELKDTDPSKFGNWLTTKAGDEERKRKAVDDAEKVAKAWLDKYNATMADARNLGEKFGLGDHTDPSKTKSAGSKHTFDTKAAERAQREAMQTLEDAVKKFSKEAQDEITDFTINRMEDGLARELREIERSAGMKREAWENALTELAKVAKETDKQIFLSQKGNTIDMWENSENGKKSIEEYIKECLKVQSIREQNNSILAAIEEERLRREQELRKKYTDALIDEFGTTEQKMEKLEREWAKKIATIPEEYREEAIRQMDNDLSNLRMEELKKNLNWEDVFGNLDKVSTKSLTGLRSRLEGIIKTQKDLSPDAMKTLVDALENIDEKLNDRNPFGAMSKAFKSLHTTTKDLRTAQEEYDKALKTGTEQEKKNAEATLEAARAAKQKALTAATDAIQAASRRMGEYIDVASSLNDMLTSFGVEVSPELQGFIDGMGAAVGGLESMDLTKPMSVITGTFKTVAGLGQAIGSLFNHDARREKNIEKMQKQVDALQRSYDNLGKTLDKVYSSDATRLIEQQNKLLEQQKVIIQNQIKEEQSKKKSDKNRISEWQQQIEDINAAIAENKEAAVDAIFGEDLKSAIENFAGAYADAWASGEDRAKSARDTVKKMMQQMVQESIKAAVQSSDQMEQIRKKLAEFYNDGILSDWEQDYVYSMAEALQKQLDEQFGWADSLLYDKESEERQGARKGIATASQDSVDENNARLTTIQGHTYSLVQGVNDLNSTSSLILEKVTSIDRNTGVANDRLSNIDGKMKDIKDMFDDINTKGVRIR